MDERNQSLEGTLVAFAPLQQQSGDIGPIVGDAAILLPFKVWPSFPAT